MSARTWLALAGAALLAGSANAQTLGPSVLGNGAAPIGGAGYRMLGTVGQPAVGATSGPAGTDRVVCSGYWCVERGSLVAILDPAAPYTGPTTFEGPRPNPSSGAVVLGFSLAQPARVEVTLHDVTGARVASPLVGDLGAGRHEARWNGRGAGGGRAAPGVYFVTFRVDGRVVDRRRIVVVR